MSELDKLLNGLSEISGAKHKAWRSLDTVEGAHIQGSVVPRYWAKGQRVVSAHGKEFRVECIGASAESILEATKIADARTNDAAERLIAAASGMDEFNSRGLAPSNIKDPNYPYTRPPQMGEQGYVSPPGWKFTNGRWYKEGYQPSGFMRYYNQKGEAHVTEALGPVKLAASLGIPGISGMTPMEPRTRIEPEPILGEVSVRGRIVAAVTRNHYGAKILNATNAMFVDIDSGHDADKIEKNMIMDRVRIWASAMPNRSIRAYATKQGVRLLFTDQSYDPASQEAQHIMAALGVVERYARLCASQGTFRARLTPKPWRIGISNPPARFPKDPADRRLIASWSNSYEIASIPYATTHFLGTIGSGVVDALIAPVVEHHDRFAVGFGALA